MDIWLLQTGELLPLRDNVRIMRTGLLAEELVSRGHKVTWWASVFDHMSKSMLFKDDTDIKLNPNLVIKALKGRPYNRNISWRRYHDHAIIAGKFRRLASRQPKPDLILSSMPDHQLAYESVIYAKRAAVPVVVDVRDEWPDTFLDFAPPILRPFLKLALARDFRMLHRILSGADAILSMMNQLLEWGLERAGREATWKDRVFYLGARKEAGVRIESLSDEFRDKLEQLKDSFVVVFIGTFGKYNNPVIIARAARSIWEKTRSKKIKFVIAGDGRFKPEVETATIGLENMMKPGWLNQDEISALLRVSSVGVIPSSEPRDEFPNKAFTYLSVGLPVISSASGDLRQFIENPGIGLHYDPNDVDGLVGCILKLYDSPELYDRLAKNAEQLFDQKLDSKIIYREYADHLEHIAASRLPAELNAGFRED